MQPAGAVVGVGAGADVVDVDVVDVDAVVVVVPQSAPLSVLVIDPVRPSEPVQSVVTVTAPAGLDLDKVCVAPVQVNDVGVPLMVTVAELVPVVGNAE